MGTFFREHVEVHVFSFLIPYVPDVVSVRRETGWWVGGE